MIGLVTPDSTSLEAKYSSVNGNMSNESFLPFCFQMFNFFTNALAVKYKVKILLFSP